MRTLISAFILILVTTISILPASAQRDTEYYRWDGQSRINLLVMGMDRRPGARDNLNARTDAIMLVSYDPRTQQIGILDIPRDMHFAVLNQSEPLLRVNTLLVEGEAQAEGYGPYFAMETFQLNFGMYIHGYIIFDFEAFIDFIDLIGGVTVDVPYNISDAEYPSMNYGFDPFYLNAGIQTLDGTTALKYARTRHGDNDYYRGERQLQIVEGVQQRLQDPSVMLQLVQNFPTLYQTFQGHVYTNIAPEHIPFIGQQLIQLDSDAINTGSLNLDYSYGYDYNGLTVQVPDRERLTDLLKQVFGESYFY
jgi:LCP family protein required for cell wall assembly